MNVEDLEKTLHERPVRTYIVTGEISARVYTKVRATSGEAAIALAVERDIMEPCGPGQFRERWQVRSAREWIIEIDLDQAPVDIEAEEMKHGS